MGTVDIANMVTSLERAADVVEAIDHPEIQSERGWDLRGWSYDLIPWGVRLLVHDRHHRVTCAIVAVALPESERAALPLAYLHPPWPTKVLLLG